MSGTVTERHSGRSFQDHDHGQGERVALPEKAENAREGHSVTPSRPGTGKEPQCATRKHCYWGVLQISNDAHELSISSSSGVAHGHSVCVDFLQMFCTLVIYGARTLLVCGECLLDQTQRLIHQYGGRGSPFPLGICITESVRFIEQCLQKLKLYCRPHCTVTCNRNAGSQRRP